MDIYQIFNNPGLFVFLVIIGLILFTFLIRAIMLWYWKIDRIVELLENIEYNTKKESTPGSEIINEDNPKFNLKDVIKRAF